MNKYNILNGVQQVVQELYNQHGEIRTRDLVDAARPKDSPAHAGFEWRDDKAAEEYRLIQARKWIRRVEVIVEGKPDILIHVPKVITDDTDSADGHYQAGSVLVNKPDEFERALSSARLRVESAERAFRELTEAAQKTGRNSEAAVLAEMCKATRLFADALRAMN